jgi:hypothetical protein
LRRGSLSVILGGLEGDPVARSRRAPGLLALVLVLGCHGGRADGAHDTDAADSEGVAPASSEGVHCPNILRPKQALVCDDAAPVCCMTGQLLTPSCTATVEACGARNSHLACDDATDCGDGESCCLAELNTGQQTFWGTCRAGCKLIEKPMCSGEGTCKEGQTCCIDEGDLWGTCVKAGTACPVDTAR